MNSTYYICDLCVGCGGCRSVCPENCSGGLGRPLVIDIRRCTGCGRCALTCPRRAIKLCGGERQV